MTSHYGGVNTGAGMGGVGGLGGKTGGHGGRGGYSEGLEPPRDMFSSPSEEPSHVMGDQTHHMVSHSFYSLVIH